MLGGCLLKVSHNQKPWFFYLHWALAPLPLFPSHLAWHTHHGTTASLLPCPRQFLTLIS